MDKKWGFSNNHPKMWPKDENGEDEAPAFLCRESGIGIDADLVQNLLEAFDIPVIRQLPLDGSFGKVVLGIAGTGIDLFVPESMLETAKSLLNSENDFSADEEISDDE